VTRASVLLEQGDIGSARIALERSAGSISGGHFLARRPGDRAGKSPVHAIAKPTTDDRRTPSSKAGKGKPTLFAEPNRGFSCKTGIVAEETIDARQLNVICLLDQSGSLICSICELGLIRADSCFAMAGDNGGAIALGGSDRDPLLIAQIAACVRL
jgi:hypothetical protein